MTDTLYERIEQSARALKLDFSAQEMAKLIEEGNFSQDHLEAISKLLSYLEKKKTDSIIATCMRLSRLPVKEPKTFENFNFEYIKGHESEKLKNLPTLSPLYARKNIAFIGPQGVGKTHLAMAFGTECCNHGMKVYFLKASELDQKLTNARKFGKVGSVVNGLVKPSCLIIDEVGRCTFDVENTRLFFDIIDRRSNKEGPNCTIFTSNKAPNTWGEYFSEDDSLLCALDRIFDDALVFMMKGKSYRGRKLETIAIETGDR